MRLPVFSRFARIFCVHVLSAHRWQYSGRYRQELPPHVYMVAEDAFRTMIAEEESQCIIISGESGAGKTESAKFSAFLLSVSVVC
jgi:myosin heavy subunit